jgi:hypothetical protein
MLTTATRASWTLAPSAKTCVLPGPKLLIPSGDRRCRQKQPLAIRFDAGTLTAESPCQPSHQSSRHRTSPCAGNNAEVNTHCCEQVGTVGCISQCAVQITNSALVHASVICRNHSLCDAIPSITGCKRTTTSSPTAILAVLLRVGGVANLGSGLLHDCVNRLRTK